MIGLCLQDNSKLCFVEAKQSSPQTVNEERFNEFIGEITDKFTHSFELWMSIVSKRRKAEISPKIGSPKIEGLKFKFILVIKGHKEEWLVPITRAMRKAMMPYIKIWESDVIVLNEDGAKKWHLIQV